MIGSNKCSLKKTNERPRMPTRCNLEPLMTMNELCAYLKKPRRTLYRWISEGKLPKPKKIGGRELRFSEAAIKEWLENESNGGL